MKRYSMTHDDRMRLVRALLPVEARDRLAKLRDREASLVTILDCGIVELDTVRAEMAELERVVK